MTEIRTDVGEGSAILDETFADVRVIVTGPPCRIDDLRFELIAFARGKDAGDIQGFLVAYRSRLRVLNPCPCHAPKRT